MTTTATWSADAEENAAVAALYELMGTLAELLHGCADARYGDPTGGHRVG